jgi:hypothetical protein
MCEKCLKKDGEIFGTQFGFFFKDFSRPFPLLFVMKNLVENACGFSPPFAMYIQVKKSKHSSHIFHWNHGEQLEILRFKFFSGKFESLPFKFSTPKFISFPGENIDEKLEF